MEWSPRARKAVANVPFFVKKKVKARIERDVRAAGGHRVTLKDVRISRKRYPAAMEEEVRGYRIETCFGADGCPNRVMDSGSLVKRLESILDAADLLEFLRSGIAGPLRFHHEFRVTLADCPNACSRPQIKDIGIIGAVRPAVGGGDCSRCGECEAACREAAVILDADGRLTGIDASRCVACGGCVAACPTGTLEEGISGYRVQLGGRLGRHPALALELPGIHPEETVTAMVADCIRIYKEHCEPGRRFGEIVSPGFMEALAEKYAVP